ncbi:hypothetical protein N7517_005203 [Penicillium concentricum]|uniref:Uncharacterized protein n=1 Tax=Penicillium concentricum TaxID=293559 RepID=A0A9W9V8Z1_9EURO|nr:uncharacterized protein N7517_005203 [Penicillium concentricum]KAJ5373197.1 hypothetical protein N7517_005203 [Penicillium concentricum]
MTYRLHDSQSYAGSSTESVAGRCVDHGVQANTEQECTDDRHLPSGKRAMYVYCYANVHGLVPSYRQIAIFPDDVEEIDLTYADTKWLFRLLGQGRLRTGGRLSTSPPTKYPLGCSQVY